MLFPEMGEYCPRSGRGREEGGGEFTRLFLEEKGRGAGIKENLDPDITAEFFSYLGLYTF